ncbi:C-type lectin domain family 10 member A-like isoform X1 [Saccostrea cucullata]|uniref:C-type lectin domain family 10 member A-like isoform X1 n=1 Tax=Saccostrea cuccullata TaxID=36930 RepID=UPI002ED2F330
MKLTTALLVLGTVICTKGCEVGWIQFQNKCYMFSHTAATWAESESICIAFHSKLAEPMTNAESKFPISHSQNQAAGQYWIGISDIIEEDRWIYSSSLQPIQVNSFDASQPNNHVVSNCVALWRPFHGRWADEPCDRHYNFICERQE